MYTDIAREAIDTHRAVQHPKELDRFLTILGILNPGVIVEVGCGAGGSLWAWKQLNPDRLIGIEWDHATPQPFESHGAEMLFGNSQTEEMVDRLTKLLDGDMVDFLFIDADHRYHGVKTDHNSYRGLVRSGGIIGFHDITPIADGRVGVDTYWRNEVKNNYESFEIEEQPDSNLGLGIGYYYV